MKLATSLSLLLVSCTPPSAERAERDEEVGRASADGIEVTVDDGLAAVREHDGHLVRLWCSAPEITVRLRSDVSRSVTVELWNAMPGARVTAIGDGGEMLRVEAEDLSIPTRKRLQIDLSRGDNSLRVSTSDAGDRRPWRFALMSDIQNGVDEVQDVFDAVEAAPGVRFLLGAGDLAITGSRDELERVRDELADLAVPYYTTLGNHDSPETGLWQELYGRGNFSFVFRGVQFTLLDSASAAIDPLAYGWLERWLDEGLSRVHLFAMHIPALDPVGTRNGAFGSRNEAGKLLAMLHQGNVALTLYGHIHSFYQFENGGIPAIISGGGGAYPEKGDGYGRHFMLVEVGADTGVLETRRVELDE